MANNQTNNEHLKDSSPTTIKLAILLISFILYFFLEHFNFATEYYAGQPPYIIIFSICLIGLISVYSVLKMKEPERKDSHLYAVIVAFGFGLFLYSFIPRLIVITNNNALKEYQYTLSNDYIWKSDEGLSPDIKLYSKSSDYWNEFKPGEKYSFELRNGGLNIWLVNMDKIYIDQKSYYDCKGYLTCANKGWSNTYNKVKSTLTN